MNCDQFEQRMQGLLDRRADVGRDRELQTHARQCSCCANRLALWMQINEVMVS